MSHKFAGELDRCQIVNRVIQEKKPIEFKLGNDIFKVYCRHKNYNTNYKIMTESNRSIKKDERRKIDKLHTKTREAR